MKNLKNTLAQGMKTKLIVACFLALAGFAKAQFTLPSPGYNTDVRDYVGVWRGGPAGWLPSYPFHGISTSDTALAYFHLIASQPGSNHIALTGRVTDPGAVANYNIGVRGDGFDGVNSFGGAFSAGNAAGTGNVSIGVYGKLDPNIGPYSAGISTGVYGDDWSTGGSGGSGPNWGGFFVGDVYTTTGYYASDRQLKDNIAPMTNALDKIMQLKPSTYTYKTDEFTGLSLPSTPQMGLIAQELEEVFPYLVKETGLPGRGKNGMVVATGKTFKTVNYVSLIPVLIAAMQEQQKQIAAQKVLIDQLMQKSETATGLNELNGAGDFQMLQNEPNPFSGETVVKYTLPENIKTANMIVYDLSGKQIASLPISERGSSSITLTSEKLAAGIYIYSIVADNKIVDSKRMVVAQK